MNKTNKNGVTNVTCVCAMKLLRLLPDEKRRMTKDVILDYQNCCGPVHFTP